MVDFIRPVISSAGIPALIRSNQHKCVIYYPVPDASFVEQHSMKIPILAQVAMFDRVFNLSLSISQPQRLFV
jgi:hypothetical protein